MVETKTPNTICPYCNQEMDSGTIIGNGRIIMFAKKEHFAFTAGEDEVMLSKTYTETPHFPAIRCKNCKKIIVDYSKL